MRYFAPLFLLMLAACVPPPYFADQQAVLREAPLEAGEVKQMLEAGVSGGVIQAKAEKAGVEKLESDEIVALKKAGAGDDLLKALIEREREPALVPDRRFAAHPYHYYYYSHPGFCYPYGTSYWGFWPGFGLYWGYSRRGHWGARIGFGW
jgi:hypothetical protein